MDLLHFLNRRLEFINHFYTEAIRPFEQTKRLIENGQGPYVDRRNPEHTDGEPAFLSEWLDTNDAISVIGHWCLCMVQASLHAFMNELTEPTAAIWWDSELLKRELAQIREPNWFDRYTRLFREVLGVDWSRSPVPLLDLEQLNLTRNDLNHNIDLMSFVVERTEKHASRFPVGLFTDEFWHQLGMEKVDVDKVKLEKAADMVRQFCAWLDEIRLRRITPQGDRRANP